jgi:hypothetical protein
VRERSASDMRIGHLRLSKEGERRLARVFVSHEAERERLREMLAELEATTTRRSPTRRRR